jgi:hypothetical protein
MSRLQAYSYEDMKDTRLFLHMSLSRSKYRCIAAKQYILNQYS